jgi:signal transduction histidine kinase
MFLRDVTGRTRRNEERRAEEAVSRVLAETERGEDLIAPIMAALGENLRWVHGGFWEYDERRGVLCSDRVWRAPDLDAPELDRMVREDFVFGPEDPNPRFSLWTGAWSSREVRWAPVSQEGPEGRLAREAGIRHAIAIPVQSGERMLGLLVFASRRGEPPQEERLQALRSIADLIGQVVERRNAELEAERMKNDFFALVSHELRTPLTSIVGYLDIVREEEAGEINDEQRRFLGVIDRNARRLQRLVGDLLFVAQVEAGTLALKSGEFDLGEVAGNAVDAARPRAEKQGVELRSDADSVTMVGDGDRLGQLVDNLVSNAIKFTPANGAVTVRLRGDGEEATLEVSDTGMGISSEDQAHLFNRFYRTDDAEKLAIPGIGLGLSICKAIVDGHGGSIAIESEEGAGTTFRVRLPVGGAPPGNGQPAGNGVRQVARR